MNKDGIFRWWQKKSILANKQRHCLDHRYILYYDEINEEDTCAIARFASCLHLLPLLVQASLTKSSPILNLQIWVDMISNVSSAFQKKKDILWRAFFLRHNLISYLIWKSNMLGGTPWKSNAAVFLWQSSDLTLDRHPKNVIIDCYLMVAFDMLCAMYIKQCNIRGYMHLMLPALHEISVLSETLHGKSSGKPAQDQKL